MARFFLVLVALALGAAAAFQPLKPRAVLPRSSAALSAAKDDLATSAAAAAMAAVIATSAAVPAAHAITAEERAQLSYLQVGQPVHGWMDE